MWNLVLADDPVLGLASGLVVGVGPKMDGLHPLMWVRPDVPAGATAAGGAAS